MYTFPWYGLTYRFRPFFHGCAMPRAVTGARRHDLAELELEGSGSDRGGRRDLNVMRNSGSTRDS